MSRDHHHSLKAWSPSLAFVAVACPCSLLLVACSAIAGSTQGTSGEALAAPGTSQPPQVLGALVTSSLDGFIAEAADPAGGDPTGPLGRDQASSADCDPGDVSQDHWIASQLRYFDGDPTVPHGYLILCVTELATAADASRNARQVGSLFSGSLVLSIGVPGVMVNESGTRDQYFYSVGRYFVLVVASSGSSGAPAMKTAIESVVQAEHRLLR